MALQRVEGGQPVGLCHGGAAVVAQGAVEGSKGLEELFSLEKGSLKGGSRRKKTLRQRRF